MKSVYDIGGMPERLLKLMQMGGVQRASDDLNRAMIRTMA